METTMKKCFLCSSLVLLFVITSAVDTIDMVRPIRDGDNIVSAGGRFKLGFFSFSGTSRYMGIWFNNINPLTVVWVANKETPLPDSSGVLRVVRPGKLVIFNRTNGVVWSSNSSRSVPNPVAQLLESGNFVLRDRNGGGAENVLWQTFDHPYDTLLPGMILGFNKITGQKWSLTSWKDLNDPSPGDYGLEVGAKRLTQLVLTKNSTVQSASGPWTGLGFNGETGLKMNPYLTFDFVDNDTISFYITLVRNSSVISRFLLNPSGMIQRYIWFNDSRGWVLYTSVTMSTCYRYDVCGAYGSCNTNNFHLCGCLKGFDPKSAHDLNSQDWSSQGCTRKTRLSCGQGDGFQFYSGLKLPDTVNYTLHKNMSLQDCRAACMDNCSCTAYANPLAEGGKNACLIWFGDLVDMRTTTDHPDDIYIKLAASDLDEADSLSFNGSHGKKRVKIIASSVAVFGVVVLLVLTLLVYLRRKQQRPRQEDGPEREDLELPFFDWDTIANATNFFSFQNKLGEGGFGPVYKGTLADGQEIAVKRLSMSSKQGIDEFKNEVLHIEKLQHRNLVRLLGYCVRMDEKLLIYEYMPNKSLDSIIFDETKSKALDWPQRFHIINGVARGLLYLHQDSRLRIIHRDLKASNVLLDKDMNPKISDFGLARSFGGNETEANTRRVVGTYGYMSPEYAIDGIYSTNSDVYSFGVMLLEILNGNRNRGFHHPCHRLNLLGHAWKLYMEGRSLELVSFSTRSSREAVEVQRSIHVGLLCVQRRPEDRPNMSYVVLMLSGDGALPPPKPPGFYNERDPFETDTSSSQLKDQFSSNDISISNLDPR